MKSLTCIVVILLALSLAVPSTALAGTKGKVTGVVVGLALGVTVAVLTGGIGIVPYGIGISTTTIAAVTSTAGAGVGYAAGDLIEEAVTPKRRGVAISQGYRCCD